ncbi:hypothetical protein BHE74_00033681 [Ensete ventricosum]|uniref:Acetyl-CoA carboxylase central domain-containing protein n=1 Tax=Ensete ventricosum TaxID=4639 RepID=A0A426ZIA5_ENSVE|nr:hypothetical protein B296_00019864 [Ensete ventricosum]RWW59416.1 hypothetical protein BHE74_00033681 [Ensete ventricosum]
MILKEMVLKIHELVGVCTHRLAVCEWEVKLWLIFDGLTAWRVVVINVTGHICIVHIYREGEDSNSHEMVYHSTTRVNCPLHGSPSNSQYQPLESIDKKRLSARKDNTTYCYDFPLAFETAL